MESLTLEQKIASFKKKIDDLERSAPASAGALHEPPALGSGNIAAMKNRLVKTGLSVGPGGLADDEEVPTLAPVPRRNSSNGVGERPQEEEEEGEEAKGAEEDQKKQEDIIMNNNSEEDEDEEEQVEGAGALEASKAAKIAGEFEKANVEAMKNRPGPKKLAVISGFGGAGAAAAASTAAAPNDDEFPNIGENKGGQEEKQVVAGAWGTDKATKLAGEFEKGKIAAMKSRLVSKGMSVNSGLGGASVPMSNARDSTSRRHSTNMGGKAKEEEETISSRWEADKAAKLAGEFKKGNIAAMKDRLASQGLGIDAAAKASRAAEDAKTTAKVAAAASATVGAEVATASTTEGDEAPAAAKKKESLKFDVEDSESDEESAGPSASSDNSRVAGSVDAASGTEIGEAGKPAAEFGKGSMSTVKISLISELSIDTASGTTKPAKGTAEPPPEEIIEAGAVAATVAAEENEKQRMGQGVALVADNSANIYIDIVAPSAAATATAVAVNGEEEGAASLVGSDRAVKLAAEFEKGKISAMKSRLVSKGLWINAATMAGEAKATSAASLVSSPTVAVEASESATELNHSKNNSGTGLAGEAEANSAASLVPAPAVATEVSKSATEPNDSQNKTGTDAAREAEANSAASPALTPDVATDASERAVGPIDSKKHSDTDANNDSADTNKIQEEEIKETPPPGEVGELSEPGKGDPSPEASPPDDSPLIHFPTKLSAPSTVDLSPAGSSPAEMDNTSLIPVPKKLSSPSTTELIFEFHAPTPDMNPSEGPDIVDRATELSVAEPTAPVQETNTPASLMMESSVDDSAGHASNEASSNTLAVSSTAAEPSPILDKEASTSPKAEPSPASEEPSSTSPDKEVSLPVPVPLSKDESPATPSSAVPGEQTVKPEPRTAGSSGPSPKVEGSTVSVSKAKAALAASKSRARPASAGTPQEKRQQRRRESAPGRSKVSQTARRPVSASPAPAAVRQPKPNRGRRVSSSAVPAQVGLRSKAKEGVTAARPRGTPASAKRRVSLFARSVSRAIPSTAATPGLHASPVSASERPTQRRRSSTPAKPRGFPPRTQEQQQQQREISTPARPPMSPSVTKTPTAEQLGYRLYNQGQKTLDKSQLRKKEKALPSSAPSKRFTPVMTLELAKQSGNRLHEQAREARERMERRRKEGASLIPAASELSPFTPKRVSNPRMGNPSVAGMERLESLYRDAVQRNSKLEMVRRAEEENPRDCTFTPEISKRGGSRGRGEKRGQGSPDSEISLRSQDRSSMSCFHALYADAKRRRAKIEALAGAHLKESMGSGAPSITARGRQAAVEPLDVRLRETSERWARKWQELEERRVALEKEGCTFMPNFSIGRSLSAPRLRSRRGGGGGDGERSGGIEAFVARSLTFQAVREKNLEKLKKEAEDRERAEVTFQPKIASREGNLATSVATGSDEGSGGSLSVFERLIRAANEQEMNKVALKKEYLTQELIEFQGFQPRLPSRQVESSTGPAIPLEERIRKSTQDWMKGRAARDRRKREREFEECTFHPSFNPGGGTGGGSNGGGSGQDSRSSSAGPRLRSSISRGRGSGSIAGSAAFVARSAALQEAREKRLSKLRLEKTHLELQEATFQPIIGAAGRARRISSVTGGASAAVAVAAAAAAASIGGAFSGESADMATAQMKTAPSTAAEKKESVGFKPRGSGRPAGVRSRESSASGKALSEPKDKEAVGPRHEEITRPEIETMEAGMRKPLPPPQQQQEEKEGDEAKSSPEAAVAALCEEEAEEAVYVDSGDEADTAPVREVEEDSYSDGGGNGDDDDDDDDTEEGFDVGELPARLLELAEAPSSSPRNDRIDYDDDSTSPAALEEEYEGDGAVTGEDETVSGSGEEYGGDIGTLSITPKAAQDDEGDRVVAEERARVEEKVGDGAKLEIKAKEEGGTVAGYGKYGIEKTAGGSREKDGGEAGLSPAIAEEKRRDSSSNNEEDEVKAGAGIGETVADSGGKEYCEIDTPPFALEGKQEGKKVAGDKEEDEKEGKEGFMELKVAAEEGKVGGMATVSKRIGGGKGGEKKVEGVVMENVSVAGSGESDFESEAEIGASSNDDGDDHLGNNAHTVIVSDNSAGHSQDYEFDEGRSFEFVGGKEEQYGEEEREDAHRAVSDSSMPGLADQDDDMGTEVDTEEEGEEEVGGIIAGEEKAIGAKVGGMMLVTMLSSGADDSAAEEGFGFDLEEEEEEEYVDEFDGEEYDGEYDGGGEDQEDGVKDKDDAQAARGDLGKGGAPHYPKRKTGKAFFVEEQYEEDGDEGDKDLRYSYDEKYNEGEVDVSMGPGGFSSAGTSHGLTRTRDNNFIYDSEDEQEFSPRSTPSFSSPSRPTMSFSQASAEGNVGSEMAAPATGAQTGRSLEDFDRAQREMEAKLRAL